MTRKYSFIFQAVVGTVLVCWCSGFPGGATIDEIIASSLTEATSFDLLGDMYGSVLRLELDMLLTVDQYLDLYGKRNTPNSRQRRKALKPPSTRWPNYIIPYSVESGTFTDSETSEIMKAIKEWENYTCISFRKANSADKNSINFEDGSGCASHIGMIKGKQGISLANGCRYKGIIAHEIGHAVGFFHEQNRPDRDDHVIINKENIIHPDLLSNFEKYSSNAVSTFSVPYDYRSIMHYGAFAFSGNGNYTIETKDKAYQNVIGNREGLSFYDIKLANLMYSCSETCKSAVTCPNEGFLGKDCQCWCPGNPITKCSRTPVVTDRPSVKPTITTTSITSTRQTNRPVVTTVSTSCTDTNPNCPAWAKSNFCQSSNYVRTYCKISCSRCGSSSGTVPTALCVDMGLHCKYWGEQGFCTVSMYELFMRKKCPVTCGLCSIANQNTIKMAQRVTEASINMNKGFSVISYSLLTILVSALNLLQQAF